MVSASRKFIPSDLLGRLYEVKSYGVTPGAGGAGNALSDLRWYDPNGNLMKRRPGGSQAFWKMTHDSLDRQTASYFGYGPGDTYTTAGSVEVDTVIEQQTLSYDDQSNLTARSVSVRFGDATGTGPLTTPDGGEPKARVSYAAYYPDALGRLAAFANYGTNAAESWERPDVAPTRSDTILVSSFHYNERGERDVAQDPTGRHDRQGCDDMGRLILQIENEVPLATDYDTNRTTEFTYSPDSGLATITAQNSVTGDQVTQFIYGTTLEDSDLASSSLLRNKLYPDSNAPEDSVFYAYNRQSETKLFTDQNGTVHVYDYDRLGRLEHDRVTALGEDLDDTILRISRSYEVRGLLEKVGSYDDPAVGEGSVVNEVQLAYNGFRQLAEDYQAHSGAVNTSTTPKVGYTYEDGSGNTVRRTGVTYPDGSTTITTGYDGDTADALSRPNQLLEGEELLASYCYLGALTCVGVKYDAASDVELTYETVPEENYLTVDEEGTPLTDSEGAPINVLPAGDGGDKYTALDRFGRLIETLWRKEGDELVHSYYGRNRFGGITWRYDAMAHSLTPPVTTEDNAYGYDGLYQVKQHQRGELTGSLPDFTGITALTQQEDFTYDPTSNWLAYSNTDPGNDQERTHNQANEITEISATVGNVTPTYDAVGNMQTLPVAPGLSTDVRTLVWDAWNRLISVSEGEDVIAAHTYDGLYRRQTKTEIAPSEVRHYFYNAQWRSVEERLGTSSDPACQYTWGLRNRWDLLRRRRTVEDPLDETLFVLKDYLDPVAIVDAGGSVVERFRYDAYGVTSEFAPDFKASESSYGWDFLFHAEFCDRVNSMYDYHFRSYSGALGRWSSRDIVETISEPNLYRFVSNLPTIALDFLGAWGFGFTGAGSVEGGLGADLSSGAAGSTGGMVFASGLDDSESSAGAFWGGGAFAGSVSAPDSPNGYKPFVFGANMGLGAGLIISNGRDVTDLADAFDTANINTPVCAVSIA